MIPLYFTWAVATGNTVVMKPSEQCPLTTLKLTELAVEAGLPAGVLNIVMGDKRVVERLAAHPDVVGATFVGSSEIAEVVFKLFSANGKRCQSQGGSKNHLVVTDTAVVDRCLGNIVNSMLGSASQRCFAGSNLLVYGSVHDRFMEAYLAAVRSLRIGQGLQPGVDLGPVISAKARDGFAAAVDRIRFGPHIVTSIRTDETEPMPWDDLYSILTPDYAFNMLFNHTNSLYASGV